MSNKIAERELYNRAHCVNLECGECPFFRTPLERKNRDASKIDCHRIFKNNYGKQLVIEEVLKSEV